MDPYDLPPQLWVKSQDRPGLIALVGSQYIAESNGSAAREFLFQVNHESKRDKSVSPTAPKKGRNSSVKVITSDVISLSYC